MEKGIEIGIITFKDDFYKSIEISKGTHRFNTKRIGECKIEVYPKEGQIPHFHIFNKDHSFESCIRIYDNHYFSHGGKYRSILSTTQAKELDYWLRLQNSRSNKDISNWEFAKETWEFNNLNCRFPQNKKVSIQPDYSKMNSFRDVE